MLTLRGWWCLRNCDCRCFWKINGIQSFTCIFKNNAEIYQIVGSQNVLYNMFREAEWTTSYDKHKIFLKILAISLEDTVFWTFIPVGVGHSRASNRKAILLCHSCGTMRRYLAVTSRSKNAEATLSLSIFPWNTLGSTAKLW